MLRLLTVANLAVLEKASAEFGPGLNVITGETGAGKSVLMGALELALGARADSSAVRDGAKEAKVEAEFELSGNALSSVSAILEEAGLPPCEGGSLVVRRSVSSTGGGRVQVNDSPATVQTLRAIGRILADLHGPTDHQSLLEERYQRSVLDAYGDVSTSAYADAWRKLCGDRARLESLKGDSSDPSLEIETLRYQLDEIDGAKLTEDDEADLFARHASAAHASEIVSDGSAVAELISGDGESAANALIEAGRILRDMSRYHEPAKEWGEQLENTLLSIQEISREIADSVSRIDADPETLAALDERVTLVQKLKRKYAPTVGEIIALAERKRERLGDLESRDDRIRELEAAVEADEKSVREAGASLAAKRRKVAAKLAKAVTKELRELGFLQSGFGVDVADAEPSSSGCDSVDFTFEPNPGERARSLKTIASSGEIARVMLAVKAVLSEHDATPVLVFDEIDSNIGGEVGKAVGEKLRAVAAHHQVVAITHLPQSAVFGERHLVVAKSVSAGRTRTEIREVSGNERVDEIARMLGGAKLTSVVTRHARELLALASPS